MSAPRAAASCSARVPRVPLSPKPLRGKVREFVPFDMVAKRAPDDVSASGLPPYEGTNDGTPISCLTEEADEYIYAYNQLRSAYGIDDLPAS